MSHSRDLCEGIVRAHAEYGSSAEVDETHHCSVPWARRMTQQMRETGCVAPRSSARTGDQHAYNDADESAIFTLIKAKPDATLAKVAEAIGKPASLGTVCRTLQRLALPRKKKSTHAAEQDRPDVALERAAWFKRFADRRVVGLVFLDEFGVNTKMQRRTARRASGSSPPCRRSTTNRSSRWPRCRPTA